ncbi:MAG: hypothetical protein Fur005_13200 [Roseiflexaceae bacterium]
MSMHIHTGTPPLINGAMARVERRLPHPGRVLVRVGQRVEPEDVVASCFVPGTPQIVNLARALMIDPAKITRAMQLEVGNKVTAGEVLARTGRIAARTCLAPVSGTIVAVDSETGYVTIVPAPVEFELRANVRGLVMEEIAHEGVRIETPAAQVYGAFGFGEERSGVLRLLVTDPADSVTPEMIDNRSAYAIVIGGSSITAAALRRAAASNVRGVIVGGIDEAELRAFLGWDTVAGWQAQARSWRMPAIEPGQEQGLTLVVTEGFGVRPMAAPLFELLASHDRQEAFIEGSTNLHGPLHRPRLVVPLSSRTPGLQIEPPRPTLRPGVTVRLLDHDHLGEMARVLAVPANPRRLPSRARNTVVDVQLEDGSTLTVPRSAVEVLG